MSKGLGPHLPQEGWGTRWLQQAAELLLRGPDVLLASAISVFIVGLLGWSALQAMAAISPLSLWSKVLVVSCLAAVSAVPTLAIFNLLMGLDGRGLRRWGELIVEARQPALFAFLINAVMMTLALTVVPPLDSSPSAPPSGAVAQVFRIGIRGQTALLASLIMINPLWIAAIPQVGLAPAQARFSGTRMISGMFPIWLSISMVTMVVSVLVLRANFIPGILGYAFLLCWLYVASREIFGGIDENGAIHDRTAAYAP